MKKICMLFNHLQLQDGVSRSAIAIANLLSERPDVEITLIPLFKYNKEVLNYLSPRVIIKPVFRGYFKGLRKIISYIPAKLLYRYIVNDKYDVNISFQYSLTHIIAAGVKENIQSIGWMHIFDKSLRFKDSYIKLDKMVCVSKSNALKLYDKIGDLVDVDYCYNPIDDEVIRKLGSNKIAIKRSDYVQFVSVGRMSEEKGYLRLLDCVKRLKKEERKFHLWLLGDGPQLSILKQKASLLQIDDVVTFLGKQNNPHAYTSKSDVFICSSYYEGYSTACTEAVILGVPVITTNVSGSEEIIEDAECGLVTQLDDESLYKGMKEVLDKPELINQWKKTLQRTRYNFSYQKRFNKFLKIVNLG